MVYVTKFLFPLGNTTGIKLISIWLKEQHPPFWLIFQRPGNFLLLIETKQLSAFQLCNIKYQSQGHDPWKLSKDTLLKSRGAQTKRQEPMYSTKLFLGQPSSAGSFYFQCTAILSRVSNYSFSISDIFWERVFSQYCVAPY